MFKHFSLQIFGCLPIEIRAQILNHLTSTRDLLNVAQTSYQMFQALHLSDSLKFFNASEFEELSAKEMAIIRLNGQHVTEFMLKGDDMWFWAVTNSFADVIAPFVNLTTFALSRSTVPVSLRFLRILPNTLRVLQLDCLLFPAQEFITYMPPLGQHVTTLALTGNDQLTRYDLVNILQHYQQLEALDIRISDFIRSGTAESILRYCPLLHIFLFTTEFRVSEARAWVQLADENFGHVIYDKAFYEELIVHRETLEYDDENGVIDV